MRQVAVAKVDELFHALPTPPSEFVTWLAFRRVWNAAESPKMKEYSRGREGTRKKERK